MKLQTFLDELYKAGWRGTNDAMYTGATQIWRNAYPAAAEYLDDLIAADSRIAELEAEVERLRADAERWRAVSAMMTHEHRGDAVGWTLSLVLPGDDLDAAIDATLTQEDHND